MKSNPERLDEEVLESLFRSYFIPLCQFATGYLKDTPMSREIVQEVFVNLWEKRDSIDLSRSVRSYLFTSVRNRCLNHLRNTRKFSSELLNLEDHPVEISGGDHDILVTEELSLKIDQAINELPEKCRQVFLLNRTQHLKYQQVADHLGISVKTVETQMSKALNHLRLRLSEYLTIIFLLAFPSLHYICSLNLLFFFCFYQGSCP